jgi:diguanylate cyclase (GGDEF)-like protein
MIDLDLKKKIANTLSKYEQKCERLQIQIEYFKNIINQLVVYPGMNYEKGEYFSQLRTQMDAEFDQAAIQKKVTRVAHAIDALVKKKEEKQRNITHLIEQITEVITRLALKSEDKRAVSKLKKMLTNEADHLDLISQLSDALTICTASVLRDLEDAKSSSSASVQKFEISLQVNQSLQELLNHLSIPEKLDTKRADIKEKLEQQLTGEDLSKVIDGLTDLVVDAFNVEQSRFKGFLQQLTNQLQNFDSFLQTADEQRGESSEDGRQLETSIQEDIVQIKNHIDSSKTIEELSLRVNQNLDSIGERIKQYRTNEQTREEEYQKHVSQLKSKLVESEHNAEEIKTLLTYQKYRINHDSLTDLPNRESYDEYVSEVIQRWKQNGKVFSLAVADIDHFKKINDTFGHLAGDKVLKKVAATFKTVIRSSDFIARFGGEEFVFIFENATSKPGLAIVEKLRKAVQDCQFVYRENNVDVTVSFGLTSVLENDNIETLFMRADKALYKAKDAGRNRSAVL